MEKRNPINNPYRPGAGHPPLFLAGREKLRADFAVLLELAARKRPGKSIMLLGLRGVGKTALLLDFVQTARAKNAFVVRIEAGAESDISGGAFLRKFAARMESIVESVDASGKKLKGAFQKFIKKHKIAVSVGGVSVNVEPSPVVVDSGLDEDLADILIAAGEAAAAKKRAILISIDELQYANEKHISALIYAMHFCAQENAPIVLTVAGLPQLRGKVGKARSYGERMFAIKTIDSLDADSSREALKVPAASEKVAFAKDATDEIYRETKGYPYFLQEWGKHCWEAGGSGRIAMRDVESVRESVRDELDDGFFRVRMARMTPKETAYLAAMADLQSESVLSAKIAERLGVKPESVSPRRDKLIERGMIYAPERGKLAFTSPLFDDFLRRHFPSRNGKF